jgi:hypothetical protein
VTTGIVSDVALTKGSPFNLFSLTKAMQQGWILGGDNTNGITLKNTKRRGVCYVYATHRSWRFCFYNHEDRKSPSTPRTSIGERNQKNIKVLGMEYYEWYSATVLATIGKAKQKNTVKSSNHEQGERIFTDIASIRPTEGVQVTKPHWLYQVDSIFASVAAFQLPICNMHVVHR